MAKQGTARLFPAIATGAALGLMLAGCVNFTPLDDLKRAKPPTPAFDLALFKNYAFLARSLGEIGVANNVAFDQEGSLSLARTDSDVAALANTFAAKAVQLSNGLEVDPEPSRDLNSHKLRDRLVRALTAVRDTYPRDAARAQADYDCWMLDAAVASLARSSDQCRRSFEVTLAQLENDVQATSQTSASAPATPAPAATPAP